MEEDNIKKESAKKEKVQKEKTKKVKKEKSSNAKSPKVNNQPKSTPKKSPNKILIVVLIALLAILLFGLFELYKTLRKEEEIQVPEEVIEESIEHSQEYEDIMSMDFKNNYPVGYLEVIEANNEIVMFEYGQEIQVGEAQDILTKQRELFAQELLDLNPLDVQVNKYTEDLANYRDIGCYIVSRKILTSEMLSYDGTVAEVIVNEQFNDGLIVQYTYNVIKQNDEWKIFSWTRKVIKNAEIDETEVTEEQK